MTVEQELELQIHVKAHHASLGCAELKRRARLCNQANELIGRLTARAVWTPAGSKQRSRIAGALRWSCKRAERRERAYYGG